MGCEEGGSCRVKSGGGGGGGMIAAGAEVDCSAELSSGAPDDGEPGIIKVVRGGLGTSTCGFW
eukprot:CAMPEP_0197414712 /NCGR_PEP_ID=MMETSP1170-20131217/1402_1 /TAXON_ID=54406 /ORGANISM="Sarcinochrysis sp, Strain CCMP770" /LENGTH=62 /DNA_ID=CAMNT_0042941445 /DNA_START=206 /DNA_END=394 /DNA_ORIENTATION=-